MLLLALRNILVPFFVSVFGLIPLICQAGPFAYIPNYSDYNVTVIDTATNSVVGLPIPVGIYPYGVAVHPAGTSVYVTNRGTNTVSVIDAVSNTVVSTVTVGNNPTGVAVNPAGTFVFVADSGGNVSVIDTASNTVVGSSINVGSNPQLVTVNPAGSFVYVANSGSGTVSVIDTATNIVVATIPVPAGSGGRIYSLAVHPSGALVYVGDFDACNIAIIDTATNTVLTSIPSVRYPLGMAFNPSGTRFYVANEWQTNTVSVFDVPTNALLATIPVGSAPSGLSINPSGTRVYVANNSGSNVSVIDTATNTVVGTVLVGSNPIAYGQFIVPASGGVFQPIVTTAAITGITDIAATGGGKVFWEGGASVTSRGVCWSTSANPTTANACTTDGTGAGTFTSSLTGLIARTEYHVRAYATNSVGTAYGSDVQFTADGIYVDQGGLCGGKSLCLTNIQDGIDSARSFTVIEITQETYYENVLLDDPKVVTLQGGWDTNFTSNSSYTTINGSVTITNGTMIFEYIVLQ